MSTETTTAETTCKHCNKAISKPSKSATRWHDAAAINSTIRCVWSPNRMKHEPQD